MTSAIPEPLAKGTPANPQAGDVWRVTRGELVNVFRVDGRRFGKLKVSSWRFHRGAAESLVPITLFPSPEEFLRNLLPAEGEDLEGYKLEPPHTRDPLPSESDPDLDRIEGPETGIVAFEDIPKGAHSVLMTSETCERLLAAARLSEKPCPHCGLVRGDHK